MNKRRLMDIAMAAFTTANDPDQKILNHKEETKYYSPIELPTFEMMKELFSLIPENKGVEVVAKYITSLNGVSG